MWTLIAIGIGMVIGWQFPQPQWTVDVWDLIKSKIFSK